MRITDLTFEKASFWFCLLRKLENLNFRLHNHKTFTSEIFRLKKKIKRKNKKPLKIFWEPNSEVVCFGLALKLNFSFAK